MKKKPFLSFILFILTVGLLFTCKKDTNEPDPSEIVIAENVRLIPNETWNETFISIDSTDYTLTFSKNLDSTVNIQPGDVIVSTAGEGLLRKVTSVNTVGDQIEVQTEFASLVDAVEQGELDVDQPLNASQIKSIEYHVPGLEFKNGTLKNSSSEKLLWEINSVIYDFDKNAGTTNDQIKLVGDFSFNLNLVAKVKISLKGIKEIKFGIASSEKLNLNLVAQLAYELPDNLDVVLATIRFSPICIYMGIVPVVLNPVLKIHIGVDGNLSATLTTGISEELSFGAGIRYTKSGGWSPYSNFRKSFDCYLPQMYINASITAYLKPEFEMKLYGVTGPYVNLKLYGRFDSELFPNPGFKIYGGISLGAGARVKILNKLEVDYAIDDIINFDTLLYEKYPDNPIENPTVTTKIGSFTSISAIIGGNVSSDGGSLVTESGVYWGTSPDPVATGTKQAIGNGLGSFSKLIQNINPNTTYYVRAYATNSNGTGYGEELNFKTLNNLVVVDVDGNIYNTVTIGSQVWFAQNLKTTRFDDGEAIPLVTDNTAWYNLSTPAFCWYNNDQAAYHNTYGILYNWYTVNTGNLCPTGWHVPTNTEWTELTDYLGGSDVAGGKLKETGTTHWYSPNTGATNETSFTALPGGYRYLDGTFDGVNLGGWWWSATENNTTTALHKDISTSGTYVGTYVNWKKNGFSVRCIRD